jgi:hypothetical protein
MKKSFQLLVAFFFAIAVFQTVRASEDFQGEYRIKGDGIYYCYRHCRIVFNAEVESFKELDYGYAQDRNYNYFQGNLIKSSDINTFEVLNKEYTKDKNGVYRYGKIIGKVDTNSFQVLNNLYLKDKNGIYLNNGPHYNRIINLNNVDSESFEVIGGVGSSYAHDKNNLYRKGIKIRNHNSADQYKIIGDSFIIINQNLIYYYYDKVKNIDPLTFKLIGISGSYLYTKDKDNLYYQDEILKLADPQTFHYINYGYSKDKDNVYYQDEILKLADPQTFSMVTYHSANNQYEFRYPYRPGVIIDVSLDYHNYYIQMYYADKNNVYFKDKIIESADPETFQYIGNGRAKDKNNVYFKDKIIESAEVEKYDTIEAYSPLDIAEYFFSEFLQNETSNNADTGSFKYLGDNYAKDINNVYYYDGDISQQEVVVLSGADPETFKKLADNYYQDQESIYYLGVPLLNADINSFKILQSGFSKDQNQVYFTNQIISSADPQSFIVLDHFHDYAKDNSHVYSGATLLSDADPDTFEIIDYFYTKDKNHVSYLNEIFLTPDAESFEFIGGKYYRDSNNVYFLKQSLPLADPQSFKVFGKKFSTRNYFIIQAKDKDNYYTNGQIIQVYSDIESTPHRRSILDLTEREIVKGYDDGTFRPLASINRAEFTKIVVEANYFTDEIESCDLNSLPFNDIDKEAWYAPYICLAYNEGVIQGYGDSDLLNPNGNINYVEALKIIYKANNDPGEENPTGLEWYSPFLEAAQNSGIHLTEIGEDLEHQLERGEMAAVMDRYLDQIGE